MPATVVVPPTLAGQLPVQTAVTQVLVGSPDNPLTAAEETTLTESIAALSSESSVYVERGWSDDLWVARPLLLTVGGVLVRVATPTATGLAVADARPDHAMLAAIGAAPGTRRLMAMGSAAVIGGLGAALGVVAPCPRYLRGLPADQRGLRQQRAAARRRPVVPARGDRGGGAAAGGRRHRARGAVAAADGHPADVRERDDE